jgi:hypothetical protein
MSDVRQLQTGIANRRLRPLIQLAPGTALADPFVQIIDFG